MFTVPVGTQPNKETIKAALKYNDECIQRFDILDNYYKGRHSIVDRFKLPGLKNNLIVVNHAKYITDINVGYLLGNPVGYRTSGAVSLEPVLEEYKKQTISDLDHEVAKAASKFGVTYELTYALPDNSIHSKLLDPRNCIMVYDDTVEHNEVFAITYSGKKSEEEYLEVYTYTATEIQEWGVRLGEKTSVPHYFGQIPVVEYRNNPEKLGDYTPVLTLIDGYNVLQSDRINDKEQLVEAILVIYGATMTAEQKTELRESRVMTMPAKLEGAGVEYLVKALNETEIDVLAKRIVEDIHKISMTPNLSDANFVGNASGVAIRYKLIAFEQSVGNKERYFERGLKKRFALYNNYLNISKNMPLVPTYDIDCVFKRNLPQNDVETAQIINALRNIVDDETLVSQLSFVDDPKKAIAAAAKEAKQRAKEMADAFGEVTPSTEGDTTQE